MKVAVVGFGNMGREVESVLRERGEEPVIVRRGTPFPADCPVGIDFTVAASVHDNVSAALRAGAGYVVGTTGWTDQLPVVRALVADAGGGMVYAANFSLGVNLFYRIVRDAATLLARFPEYDPYVFERHHRKKRDAPSGTAKVLGAIIEGAGGRRRKGVTAFEGAIPDDAFHVSALRAGGIVGDHTVGFDSGADEILIEHRARSRRAFAQGAVLAASWIASRKGVYTFEQVLDDLSRSGT